MCQKWVQNQPHVCFRPCLHSVFSRVLLVRGFDPQPIRRRRQPFKSWKVKLEPFGVENKLRMPRVAKNLSCEVSEHRPSRRKNHNLGGASLSTCLKPTPQKIGKDVNPKRQNMFVGLSQADIAGAIGELEDFSSCQLLMFFSRFY